MTSTIERYKGDLDRLILAGERLHLSMQAECYPSELNAAFKAKFGAKAKEQITGLPDFSQGYQSWYSEARVLLKQLLPDRLADFVRHHEKPKSRKDITFENYKLEDYLQGLRVTSGYEKTVVVGPSAAITQFAQQIAILKAVEARFVSSLFDIRQLVQADVFDSELDAAKELARSKFTRAAGALAGVVLERHLGQVCETRSLKPPKKAPTIGDLNAMLKEAAVIDTPQWRYIQHLADIRNLCDHSRAEEPTTEQVNDLIAGVAKIIKTVF